MTNGNGWMPLYIGDYLGDTMELDGPKHGAYLLLLMHYWRNGPLPLDDATLAQIARTDLRVWKKTVGPTVRAFFTERDGKLHQKRADIELAKAAECHQRTAEKRQTDNDRLKSWRAKQGQDGRHPPHQGNGTDPPETPDETRFNRVSEHVSKRQMKRTGNADETRTTSTITLTDTSKEERELINKNPLPLNGLVRTGMREGDALETLLAEAGVASGRWDDDEEPSTDPLISAHIKRAAKACEMRVPYGTVRGKWDQVAASDAPQEQQPTVVENVPYRWAPVEPVRTVKQQLAELERMMRSEAAIGIAAE